MSGIRRMTLLGAAVLSLMLVVVMSVMAAGTIITIEDVEQTEFGMVTEIQFAADVPADSNLAAFTIEVTFDEAVATFAADAFDERDSPFSLTCNPDGNKVICSGFDVNGFADATVNLFSLPFRCIQAGTLMFSAETISIVAFTNQNGAPINFMFDDGSLRCNPPRTPTSIPSTSTPTFTPTLTPTLTNTPLPTNTPIPTAIDVPTTIPTMIPATATDVPPDAINTATSTPGPTDTPSPTPTPPPTVPPTAINTPTIVPTTNTAVPPTETVMATETPTPITPTATAFVIDPTIASTIEPTADPMVEATITQTPIPPTATVEPILDNDLSGIISGIVFLDDDQNGVHDPDQGEKGLRDVVITLLSETGMVWVAMTDANGLYHFDDLMVGQLYTVHVGVMTLPADTIAQTTTGVDSDGGITAVVVLDPLLMSGTTTTFVQATASFGFIPAEPTTVAVNHWSTTAPPTHVIWGVIIATFLMGKLTLGYFTLQKISCRSIPLWLP